MAVRLQSWRRGGRWLLPIASALLLGAAADAAVAQDTTPAAAADTAMLPMAQLEALVAPIALYPDPLLAQTLVASTYPLEIIQLQQWLAKHPDLKDKALADSVAKQPWDPSIQSMAAVPDVVKRLADDIQWTTALGNAFLAQQAEVMTAVQTLRKKAVDKGALETNEQQVVDTQVVETQTVIVVQPANPEVVYVPVYSPTVVYGPPVYPYPPIYYPPPPPPGAYFVAFTVGVAWRAAWWGGSCCYAGWGHGGGNTVIINNNNHFNQINHYGGGNNNWQHNPSHRGGTPYPSNTTANKYRDQAGSAGGRAPSASTRPAGGAGQAGGGRAPSASTRPTGGAGGRAPTASTRPSTGTSNRVPNAGTQPSRGTGANQVGGRNVPSSRGGQSGFSGGQGGYNGASARASSSRGAASMSSRGGGGGGRRR